MEEQGPISKLTHEYNDTIASMQDINDKLRRVTAQFSRFNHLMDSPYTVMEVTENGINLGKDGIGGFIARDATEQFYNLVKELQEAKQNKERMDDQWKALELPNMIRRP